MQPSWTDIASALGQVASALFTLFGFIFVVRQIRLGRESSENAASGLVYQLSHSVYRLFVDNPDLRPYFYEGREMPSTEPDRSRILATSELLCDFFEHIVHADTVLDPPLRQAWISYMQMLHSSSSVIRNFVDAMEDQYTELFLSTIRTPPAKELGQAPVAMDTQLPKAAPKHHAVDGGHDEH